MIKVKNNCQDVHKPSCDPPSPQKKEEKKEIAEADKKVPQTIQANVYTPVLESYHSAILNGGHFLIYGGSFHTLIFRCFVLIPSLCLLSASFFLTLLNTASF